MSTKTVESFLEMQCPEVESAIGQEMAIGQQLMGVFDFALIGHKLWVFIHHVFIRMDTKIFG